MFCRVGHLLDRLDGKTAQATSCIGRVEYTLKGAVRYGGANRVIVSS